MNQDTSADRKIIAALTTGQALEAGSIDAGLLDGVFTRVLREMVDDRIHRRIIGGGFLGTVQTPNR